MRSLRPSLPLAVTYDSLRQASIAAGLSEFEFTDAIASYERMNVLMLNPSRTLVWLV